jgi:site-specific recombinase XerD
MNDTVYHLLSQKSLCRNSTEYVFTRGGKQIDGQYLSHKFKDYVTQTELDGRLHWHSLRHTFASWLVQDGVSLFEVQKLLEHFSSEMTLIYSHLQPEQLHNTVNRIVLNVD